VGDGTNDRFEVMRYLEPAIRRTIDSIHFDSRRDSGSDSILVVGGAIFGVGDGTNDRFDLLRFDSILFQLKQFLERAIRFLEWAMRVGDASRRCE
jgi:hypothetical protein